MQIENKEFRKNILPIFKQNIEKLIYVINTWKIYLFEHTFLKTRKFMWEDFLNKEKKQEKEADIKTVAVQSLIYIINISYFNTLVDLWIHPKDIKSIATPVCQKQNWLAASIFSFTKNLWIDMIIENKESLKEMLPILEQNIQTLSSTINIWNTTLFENIFKETQSFIWKDFLESHKK
jgi:prephenate dehydrogenase